MGGQNHQPTRPDITPASAWLSKQIGSGVISIQQANNHLEDAIMLAMRRLHITDLTPALRGSTTGHLELSASALSESLEILQRIDSGFGRVSLVAEEIGYRGNPLACSVRSLRLEDAFDGKLILPTINHSVWNELLCRIEADNILGTLDWERQKFRDLTSLTSNLIDSTRNCVEIATTEGDDALAAAVENNRVPFRQHYARVFSSWNYLSALFLYSALVMTELYYRVNAYPSLTEFKPINRRVTAA